MSEDDYIELATGTAFYFNRTPHRMSERIFIQDIAHSISRLCRYNGHTHRFYSVAEHSLIMSEYVERLGGSAIDCLTALHHDDAEYIIGDLPRPIKNRMSQFKELEEKIDHAVSLRFGTTFPFPPWLKELDRRIIKDERASVMKPSENKWAIDDLEPLGVKFKPITGRFSWMIEGLWIARHQRLT